MTRFSVLDLLVCKFLASSGLILFANKSKELAVAPLSMQGELPLILLQILCEDAQHVVDDVAGIDHSFQSHNLRIAAFHFESTNQGLWRLLGQE